ncbi:hypothetical protein NLM16_16475 [Bradyrhizobium brasilense]|uniref:CmcI family methyltransferase n=1 Tax=Bradyrhizobium brasilense TaxID=1419277 RepID=UPI0028775C16|nr:CmcI family methyltransferase [Bradyrhizobium brasilense]MCP3415705.1 hypothetical protein [Bradyrhizobium brasilense]
MKLASGYKAFWDAARENYPDQMRPGGPLETSIAIRSVVNGDFSDRFARPSERGWTSTIYPKTFPDRATKKGALALTYRGLIQIKTPFDLALYTRLIWELQPRTILELGSWQGGSALWFADHMSVLCDDPGEVHSFDLHTKCIHESARHPLLTFHEVDLSDVATFNENLLMKLPHPWLVIDDAHVEIFKIFSYLNRFLVSGDYYVIEDNPMMADKEIIDGLQLVEQLGFLVDTYYTDAYGSNLTCAPNAWLRKS